MIMNQHRRSYRRLRLGLFCVIGLSFLGLAYFGSEIYRKAPPIHARVVTTDAPATDSLKPVTQSK
jgi:nitric oxide reductase large subunit